MNCFSCLLLHGPVLHVGRILAVRAFVVSALWLTACGAPVSETQAQTDERSYLMHYTVTLQPAEGVALVELELRQSRHLLREMRFDAGGVTALKGDGSVVTEQGRVTWLPPAKGGSLRWHVEISHRRNSGGYDAWLGSEWGLFRAEDLIPRAATLTLRGARSETSFSFDLPRRWSVVTEYRENDGRFAVDKAGRRFEQPSGWIVAGELGVRRDRIAGVRVAVAAPEDEGVRRLDILALLNWTLPELGRILPDLPQRLTVVSVGDPMWRGALSAPQSIYMHAERPLISENGTSTLLHELMHVALGARAKDGFDWILEGLAEYYSIELLGRSGTLTADRYRDAVAWQHEWSAAADTLCADYSSAATTALGVVTFHALDREIRDGSAGKASLDDVVRLLLQQDTPLDAQALSAASAELIGKKPDALHIDKLPGCRKLMAAVHPT